MIIRSLIRAQAPIIASRRVLRVANRSIKTARRYSTSNASMASSTPQSQASMLATITTDLDKIAPRFEIRPEQITIIQTPTEFYETLRVGSFLSYAQLLLSSYASSSGLPSYSILPPRLRREAHSVVWWTSFSGFSNPYQVPSSGVHTEALPRSATSTNHFPFPY